MLQLNLMTMPELEHRFKIAMEHFNAKETETVSFEAIDGVSSWSILVLPEFLYTYNDDHAYFQEKAFEFLTEECEHTPATAYDILDSDSKDYYKMHMSTYWEYDGEEFGDFQAIDMSVPEDIIAQLYRDYLEFVKQLATYELDSGE